MGKSKCERGAAEWKRGYEKYVAFVFFFLLFVFVFRGDKQFNLIFTQEYCRRTQKKEGKKTFWVCVR